MTMDSSQLLRMLEPTVRPVSTPAGGGAGSSATPLEQQSFDALLAEAQQAGGGGDGEAAATVAPSTGAAANPLGRLADVGAIENVSLRAIVERRG